MLQRHLIGTALAAALALLPACGDSKKGGGTAAKTGVVRFTELPPAAPTTAKSGPLHFVSLTREAGISFKVETGSKEKLFLVESIGQGVMLFDYDNDGDLDLYFAQGGELRAEPTGRTYHNALYRNDGGWRFTDVTDGSGLESPEWSLGVYAADYDGDGFEDVYVTKLGKNRLYRNLGNGRFKDVTDEVGGGCEQFSSSAAFFDADQDGDLDLFVCNYVVFDIKNPPNRGLPCRWKELQVSCGPRGLPEATNVFYENADGKFVDATAKFGFAAPRNGKPIATYSLGVVTTDFDRDGDQDVYVAVDSRPSLMYENLGGGKFREVAQRWQVALNAEGVEQAGMGVATGDVNGDGWMDIFRTNFSHDTDTLYVNAAAPKAMYFNDETYKSGLGGDATFAPLSWSTTMQDFDCDGRVDIFVVSGHVYPQAEGVANLGTSYAQLNQIFMQTAPMKFANKAAEAGPAMQIRKVSRGAAFGDIDRDGRIDVVVSNLDDWPDLIRNESDIVGGWLGVRLQGAEPKNRAAIGAHATLEFADGSATVREIVGGGGYLGSNDRTLHFGFAADKKPIRLKVRWPNGAVETCAVPASGRYFGLSQGRPELVSL